MKRRSWFAAALAVVLVIASCGGDDDDSDDAADTTGGGATAPSDTTTAATDGAEPAEAVDLVVVSNAIRGGKNDAEATWIEDYVIPEFETAMEAAGTPVNLEFAGRGVDDEDYKTQLALDLGSGEGADVISIDGIWVGEFATADYIAPLDEVVGSGVEEWEGWGQIPDAVEANITFEDARYGIPQGTDGRVIYFNKELFAEAGLPEDWQPATVDEVLEAARTIKEALPDVTPLQLNAGVPMGEATTMQGVLPLLAAAGAPIYDEESSQWTGASPALTQVLETYAAVYGDEQLGDPDLQVRQDGRDRSFQEFAEGNIAMLIEGDYFWRDVVNPDVGIAPMENRDEVVGWARIPAYEPGGALDGLDAASMSGGAVWVVNPNSENPELAWELMTFMNSKDAIIEQLAGQPKISQREDVNAEVLTGDPMLTFIAEEVLPVTHFRPALAEYPQVSVALQEATEAVVTGTSPEDAAADYQANLERIVGADAVSGE
jgi:multiple sugar transport system substrate-binding protein